VTFHNRCFFPELSTSTADFITTGPVVLTGLVTVLSYNRSANIARLHCLDDNHQHLGQQLALKAQILIQNQT
jgi:hypothetical protein